MGRSVNTVSRFFAFFLSLSRYHLQCIIRSYESNSSTWNLSQSAISPCHCQDNSDPMDQVSSEDLIRVSYLCKQRVRIHFVFGNKMHPNPFSLGPAPDHVSNDRKRKTTQHSYNPARPAMFFTPFLHHLPIKLRKFTVVYDSITHSTGMPKSLIKQCFTRVSAPYLSSSTWKI